MIKNFKAFRAFIFLFLCSCIMPVAAAIHETNNISEILPHVQEGTLLVFDLDNTLIETKQSLGSDQWFTDYLHQQKTKGLNSEEALVHTLKYYDQVHDISDVALVDANIIQMLSKLEKEGAIILGLTTRGARLKEATFRQLASVGIHFKPVKGHEAPYRLKISSKDGLVESGIIFVSGAHKGKSLVEYLNHLKLQPKHIVFVDDKHKNVSDVQQAVEEKGIKFTGFRYAYLDEKVKAFNREISEIQLQYLNKILSDEDAAAIYAFRQQKQPRPK